MRLLNSSLIPAMLAFLTVSLTAQDNWYKFNKAFIHEHYSPPSAIGTLKVQAAYPAANVHAIDCGGDDGELHIGMPGNAVVRSNADGKPISAFANDNIEFGLVAEPPNVKATANSTIQKIKGKPSEFVGYFRVWNEGHDVGAVHPSNPHHVMEVHPAWGIRSTTMTLQPTPTIVFPPSGYSGYGASKFVPLLTSLMSQQWLRVAEDNSFVYVQLRKADNFYQLPVAIKAVQPISGGVEALVDVYSGGVSQRLIYNNLTVVAANGTVIAQKLRPGAKMYLLGFFSVNLGKALVGATGHQGASNSVFSPASLEFFTFGVPQQKAVLSSQCNVDPSR